jgi:hypothetical protein
VAEVPEGFPSRLTDEQLAESIEEWSAEYRHRWPQSTLPELVIAFINTASQEQLRRQMVAATDAADRAAKQALVVARFALLVGLAA